MAPKGRLLLASAVAGLAMAPLARAQVVFQPTVDIHETWSDNPTLAADGQKHNQLISQVSPGFTLTADSNRVELRATYQMNLYQYSDRRLDGSDVINHALALTSKARLLGENLFLDVKAGVSQQPVSPFAPISPGADYVSTNRSEIRSFYFSPYWVERFGAFAVLNVRYTHDVVNSDNGGLGNSNGDSIALQLSNGPSLRRWGWDASLTRQTLDDHVGPPSSNSNANFGLRIGLGNTFSLLENVGFDRYSYENSPGNDTQGPAWSTGFNWEPSNRTKLQLTAGRRYYGPSYGLSGSHRSRHTVWLVSYGDSVTTSRQQFLLPSAVDTAALLNTMLLSQIPDPVARAAAVTAFIRANNLPNALPNSINYFSNRYILQKQATASAALTGSHATMLFSVYRTRRSALSSVQEDSTLLGSQSSELYDNTDQRGASVIATYNLSSRTSTSLSNSYSKTDSLSLSQIQTNRAWRWLINHEFQKRLNGTLELRRSRNTLSAGAGNYTENAVAATLSMQF